MLAYCTSLMLFAGTVFILLSIIHVENTMYKNVPKELILSVPERSDVFSTVVICVKLSAKIKSGIAIVRIEGNRLWSKSDTVILLQDKDHIELTSSFADTGVKSIECIIVNPDGKAIFQKTKIAVTLPLKPLLRAVDTDSLIMTTQGVRDSVNYVWEFDNGLIVYANNPHVALPHLELGTYSGMLYIECSGYRSPEVKFSFNNGIASFYNYY